NGSGKTRLSKKFKQLVAPKNAGSVAEEQAEQSLSKILYYNAFTEDLFYWDNDLKRDAEPILKIQPNKFTDWILKDQGQDLNIVTNFQHYTNQNLTPWFNAEYKTKDQNDNEINIQAFSEVMFSLEGEYRGFPSYLKISKSEESNFIWCIFYSLLEMVIDILSVPDPNERETDQFNQLEYVFIDDPVTSLDENHLIELAVDLAGLIKRAPSNLKFIITTHNPLFLNVLFNELNKPECYLLEQSDNGFELLPERGHPNICFSYHLYLKQILEKAVDENRIEKYHFTLLRNLYEKTALFLGYPKWSDLLPDDKQVYLKRIINFTSHSTLSNETVPKPNSEEKRIVKFLLDHLLNKYGYWRQEKQHG
ncbi:AAA family ATPase, partial [Candidatus Saccharibacteria bacterium]|nr:AAA family ATPase [Candidatus Saccharibacteria bacterium]